MLHSLQSVKHDQTPHVVSCLIKGGNRDWP